jgi:hypothetical protein
VASKGKAEGLFGVNVVMERMEVKEGKSECSSNADLTTFKLDKLC